MNIHSHTVARGVVVEVEDRGLGLADEDLEAANAMLSGPPEFDAMALRSDSRLGLFVVARLADRHEISVELRTSAYGGTRAVVLLPSKLIVEPVEPDPAEAHTSQLPRIRAEEAATAGAIELADTGFETALPADAWPADAETASTGVANTADARSDEVSAPESGAAAAESTGSAADADPVGTTTADAESTDPAFPTAEQPDAGPAADDRAADEAGPEDSTAADAAAPDPADVEPATANPAPGSRDGEDAPAAGGTPAAADSDEHPWPSDAEDPDLAGTRADDSATLERTPPERSTEVTASGDDSPPERGYRADGGEPIEPGQHAEPALDAAWPTEEPAGDADPVTWPEDPDPAITDPTGHRSITDPAPSGATDADQATTDDAAADGAAEPGAARSRCRAAAEGQPRPELARERPEEEDPSTAGSRSAAEIRSLMSAIQRGTDRGRKTDRTRARPMSEGCAVQDMSTTTDFELGRLLGDLVGRVAGPATPWCSPPTAWWSSTRRNCPLWTPRRWRRRRPRCTGWRAAPVAGSAAAASGRPWWRWITRSCSSPPPTTVPASRCWARSTPTWASSPTRSTCSSSGRAGPSSPHPAPG
ncbi:hypothetical protein GCM10020366_08720 [Saccharopolyspora gregorii]|uniref:histidine kinase n=1 Tax=Saccharopolyspora gregorii TaxID=33914 RepID=A0ABP6RQE3_9PSEU